MNDFERLGFGFTFADLNGRDGLIRLDKQFLQALVVRDPGLHHRLLAARAAPEACPAATNLIWSSRWVPISTNSWRNYSASESDTAELRQQTLELEPIHACKRLFVQRQAVKKYPIPRLRRPRSACSPGSSDRRPANRKSFATQVAASENER